MTRVLDVARIQLVNWPAVLGYPLAVLVAMPLLGLGIDASNGELGSGDHVVFLLPMLWGLVASAHLQTMTQVFPFALGLGVTRRTFALATALVVTAQAALFGLGLLAFGLAERLTGGWGRHARIFEVPALQAGPVTQWLVFVAPLLAVATLGVLMGIVFQRWRQTGIYLSVFGSIALLAGAGVLATSRDWSPSLGGFLTGQPALALYAGYPLAAALLFGGAGWLILRRATA
jgi:hypothetical protein